MKDEAGVSIVGWSEIKNASNTDKLLESAEEKEIYSKSHSRTAFTEASNFKTYEELQKRLNTVLNTKKQPRIDMETEENELEDMSEGRGFNVVDITNSRPAPEPVREEIKPRETSSDDDDALSFFANLAEFDD